MITLFDQETAERLYVASVVREAAEKAEKAAEKAARKAAREAAAKAEKAAAKAVAKADKAARADERLTAIKSLMETTNWSAVEAMNAMKIPADQQAIYIKKL